MFHLLSAPKLIKTRRGDPSNQWTCCKLGGGLYRCVCVCQVADTVITHTVQWWEGRDCSGIQLAFYGTTALLLAACLSFLLPHSFSLSPLLPSIPCITAFIYSLPHCTRRPTLSLPVFLFDISEPSLIPFHCLSFAVSPKFSPHLIQLFFLSLFFPIPLPSPGSQKRFSGSPPPTHPVHPPIPSTPAMSVIPSLFLRGIRALQCTVWMPNESHAFYKPQPSPISVLPLSSSF